MAVQQSDEHLPQAQLELAPDIDLKKLNFQQRATASLDLLADVLADEGLNAQPELKRKILGALAGISNAFGESVEAIELLKKQITTLQPRLILPKNLILVRHGESEKNLLNHSPEGTFTAEVERAIRLANDNEIRLTPRGAMQAEAAGHWLKDNLDFDVDKAMTSGYVRARETTGHLGVALGLEAEIYKDPIFSEQWFGEFDLLPKEERDALMARLRNNPRHQALPSGESQLDKEFAFRLGLAKFRRKYSDQNVMVVCHGVVMTAGRSVIEKIPDNKLKEISDEGVPNCGILQYSRQNPITKEWGNGYDWVRMTCPWDPKWGKSGEWNGHWRYIQRPVYTPESLLEEIEQYPRYLPYDLSDGSD